MLSRASKRNQQKANLEDSMEPSTSDSKVQALAKTTLDQMQDWIACLDYSCSQNTVCHKVLLNCFAAKLQSSIRKHQLFWHKLVGSIISSVHHRPETTICWLNFTLINCINEGKISLPPPDELFTIIEPFVTIEALFKRFADEVQGPFMGYYRLYFEAAEPGKVATITITILHNKTDVVIAKITKHNLSEVVRNTCLVVTLLICLSDEKTKVRDLVMHSNGAVLNFLSDAILKIKNEAIEEAQLPWATYDRNQVRRPRTKIRLVNALEQFQTTNFALLAFLQCFDEFPDEPFNSFVTEKVQFRLAQIAADNAQDFVMGRIPSWPMDKAQFAAITLQVLANRVMGKMHWADLSKLVGTTDGMTPFSWGHWVFGNYALGHQTYQFTWTNPPVVGAKYYAEIRPLTSGPIKVGFASSIVDMPEESQHLHLVPDAICYCFYENSLWIYQQEYIPIVNAKIDENAVQVQAPLKFPDDREQVIIGILLDTGAETELEAVRFFINGQEVNSMMNITEIPRQNVKPWKIPSQYFLSIAPAAYQQAILVPDREFWEYNQGNPEFKPFLKEMDDDVTLAMEQQVEQVAVSPENGEGIVVKSSEDEEEQDLDNLDDTDIDKCILNWSNDYRSYSSC